MPNTWYDVNEEMWPDLKQGRIVLMPARVGVDRNTGKVLIGWAHVVQSIQVIFATRFHERVLRRWCGSFVPHLLGDSATTRVIARFYWAIVTAIDLWEPNYRIKKIHITTAGRDELGPRTSAEDLRQGHLNTETEGQYRPRAHVGDDTPEQRQALGLIGRWHGSWEQM